MAAAETQGPSGHGPGHPPSSPGSTVLRMARTRPRGEPKRKKSDTSKSRRPRLTSGGWDALGAGVSASSFSTLEWMLSGGGREPAGPLGTACGLSRKSPALHVCTGSVPAATARPCVL